jgi:pimeloyl-ACP methyl ester carboxylesterase
MILIFLSACQSATPTPESPGIGLDLADCELTAPGSDLQVAAQCATHTVYENRTTQAGRQIDLNIAVVPAVSRSPEADPLFFLTGGPGQAATESYLQLASAFSNIRQTRDIVLVDQRGTGQSHALRCEFDEDQTNETDDIKPFIEECLASLDADPAQYTTSIAMQDLDEVRELLGYDQINIYGVSYGTRAAMTYMRMYPDNVRAVILDGVAPLQIPLVHTFAVDAQNAFDWMVARCEATPACAEAFPGLAASFEMILSDLEAEPVEVSLAHPISGEQTSLAVTRDIVATVVRFHSYSPETIALLPLAIHTTSESGDYTFWASQFLMTSSNLTDSISNGMGYSVLCAEDIAFYNDSQIAAAEDSYLGTGLADAYKDICDVWPVTTESPNFKEPLQSDTPVLLLSGEYDPVTPPAYGALAAETLSNSLHLVIPGQGHNVIFRGCVPRLASAFINAGATAGLDAACIEESVPFPFFVNFSGPTP